MPGEATALIAAGCYALSYVFLRKGQSESALPDHGLLPILMLGVLTLGTSCVILSLTHSISFNLNGIWGPVALYSALSGVVGTWLGRMALYGAIDYIGATRGVVIKSLASLVTLVIAYVILGERLDILDTAGMVCLFTGVGLVLIDRSWVRQRGLGDWLRRGMTLGILAALLQGIGHAMRKLATLHPWSPLLSSMIDISTAFTAYLLWLSATGRLQRVVRFYASSYNPSVMAAGFLSAAGIVLFFTAVGTAPVSTVSVIIGTEPVLVAFLSVFMLRRLERLTVLTVLASLLVAAGVILTSLDQTHATLWLSNRPWLFHVPRSD